MILTPRHTCPKAAQELLDTYGRERVRVVLASIRAKPVTETFTERRVANLPVTEERRATQTEAI